MVKKNNLVNNSNLNKNILLILGVVLGVVIVFSISNNIGPVYTGYATDDGGSINPPIDVDSCELEHVGVHRCSNGGEQTCEQTRDGGQWSSKSSCTYGCDRNGIYCRCSPGEARCLSIPRVGEEPAKVNQQCDQYGEWHSEEGNACSTTPSEDPIIGSSK